MLKATSMTPDQNDAKPSLMGRLPPMTRNDMSINTSVNPKMEYLVYNNNSSNTHQIKSGAEEEEEEEE